MDTESSIQFVRWPYDDEAWHVGIRAVDGGYRVEQEFYTYPADLLELAKRLCAFRADEVLFEVGSKDPEWAHWVSLRVFIADTAGHAAVTVDVAKNGDEFTARSARLTMRCDVALLNRLGEELRRWVERPDAPLLSRLYSS